MSTWYAEQLRCPGCGHAFSARLARGVHASRLPQVRAAILAGELHRVTCVECGATIDVHRDLAYTDFDRRHWVQLGTPAELAAWASLEREASRTFDRAMSPPAVRELAGSFRVRLVFDLDELRERLVIWDADLDDAIVECVKLRCLGERPSLRAPGERLRVRAVVDGALTMGRILADEPRRDLATWTVPRAVVADVAASVAEWRGRFPALFERGFVSIDRYLAGGDA